MKRVADKQLVKGDEEGEDKEVEELEGFRKADDEVLARRPMKGLPKRATPGGAIAANPFGTPDSAKSTSTSSFGGFGIGSSSSFTFSSPAATTGTVKPSIPATSSFQFGGSSTNSSSSSFSFSGTPPASKPPSKPSFNPTTNGASSMFGDKGSSTNGTSKDEAVNYYKSLRGLNVSLLAMMRDTVDKDPFSDLTELLDRYKSLRATIVEDHEKESKKEKPVTPSFSSSIFGNKTTTSAPPATPSSMPSPPKAFSGFGSFSSTSSPSSSQSTVKADSSQEKIDVPPVVSASFSFSTPPSNADKSAPSPFTFGSAGGFKPSAESKASTNGSPFSFPTSSTVDTKSASVFGSAVFGTPTPSTTTALDRKTEGNSTPSSSNIFGSSSASTSPGPSNLFSFGKPGSFGKPVGFSFGTPTPEPETSSDKSTPGPSGLEGALVPSSAASEIVTKPLTPPSEVSRAITPATTEGGDVDEAQKNLGTNPNDEEGEGEQGEETTHTSRVKVFKMGEKEGNRAWIDVGVGMLRLKKDKESGARRILSRNSATGKIMLNFKLYTGLKTTRSKQTLSFVGHEEGKNTTYRVKVKDESGAIALQDAIDADVASL